MEPAAMEPAFHGAGMVQLQTVPEDGSGDRGDAGPSEVDLMKRDLLLLRRLLVNQERTRREELKRKEKVLDSLRRSLELSKQKESLKLEEVAQLRAENNTSLFVMKEYEKLIECITSGKEEERFIFDEKKQSLEKKIITTKEQMENAEKAFVDLEMKDKDIDHELQKVRDNVQVLQQEVTKYSNAIEDAETMFSERKKEAETRCTRANEELESLKWNHHLEVMELTTLIKTLELKAGSLKESLEQEHKENKSLAAMYDELINSKTKSEFSLELLSPE